MGKNKNILIIGDTIVDRYIFLEAVGLSLEYPCIKSNYLYENIEYGGAANVAKYASLFGCNVTFLTAVSKISEKYLNKAYDFKIINIIQTKDNTKTRYLLNKNSTSYQYLQVNDTNFLVNLSYPEINFSEYECIAFSDYRFGLINKLLIDKIIKTSITTFAASQVSSNKSNFDMYSQIDYIVCNEHESSHLTSIDNAYITKGENGCSFKNKHYKAYEPSIVKKIIGAGDCFYAALLAYEDPDKANKLASDYISGKI